MSVGEQEMIEILGEHETIDGRFSDISGLQSDIDGELNEIFSEFGGGDEDITFEIRVYRTQQGKGKVAYVFACMPHELPILDRLRDEYGGGDFEVRVLKSEKGNKNIFRRLKVAVEPPPKRAMMSPQSETTGLVNVMAEGFTRLGELIAAQNAAPKQEPVDVIAMQGQMLQNMVAMKEIMNGDMTPARDPLEDLMKVVTLQKKLGIIGGDEDKKESTTTDLLMTLANNVLPLLGNATREEQRSIAARQGGAKTPENRVKQNPADPIEKTTEVNDVRFKLKTQLIYLCGMAAKNSDPAAYAQLVIDNTEPEDLVGLYTRAKNGDFMGELTKIHAGVANYVEWFDELASFVVEICDEMNAPEDETLTENGEGAINADNNSPEDENVELVSNDETTVKDTDNGDASSDTGRKGGDAGDIKSDATVGTKG